MNGILELNITPICMLLYIILKIKQSLQDEDQIRDMLSQLPLILIKLVEERLKFNAYLLANLRMIF